MVCQALSQPTKDSLPDTHLLHLLELVTLTPRGWKVLIPPVSRWMVRGISSPPPDPAPALLLALRGLPIFWLAPNSQGGCCENPPKLNMVRTGYDKCEWRSVQGALTALQVQYCRQHQSRSAETFSTVTGEKFSHPYTLWEIGSHVKDSGRVSECGNWGHKSLNDSAIKDLGVLASYTHGTLPRVKDGWLMDFQSSSSSL